MSNQNSNERPELRNVNKISVTEDSEKKHPIKVPLPQIIRQIRSHLDRAPLVNVGGTLHWHMPVREGVTPKSDEIKTVNKVADLRAYAEMYYSLRWSNKPVVPNGGRVTVDRCPPVQWSTLRSGLESVMPEHESIEYLPHYPPRRNTYYLRDESEYEDGDGSALKTVVDAFNANSERDRELLKAMLMTPLWGGRGGDRPMFVLTSPHGRGVGKTTTVEWLELLYDGSTQIDPEDSRPSKLQRDLGTPEEVRKRLVRIDNMVDEVNSATYASMITSRNLSADRLYHGSVTYPNIKTYIMTANGVQLNADLADRSVIIEIGPPPKADNGRDIGDEIKDFIEENRTAIIRDILAELRATPSSSIPNDELDRWSTWTNAILTRFDNGPALNRLVQSRRSDVDTEADRAQDLIEIIRGVLADNGIEPDSQNTCIPASALRDDLKYFWDVGSLGTQELWNRLKPYFSLEPFRRYRCEKGKDSKAERNGLRWQPDPSSGCEPWSEVATPGSPILLQSGPSKTRDSGDDDTASEVDEIRTDHTSDNAGNGQVDDKVDTGCVTGNVNGQGDRPVSDPSDVEVVQLKGDPPPPAVELGDIRIGTDRHVYRQMPVIGWLKAEDGGGVPPEIVELVQNDPDRLEELVRNVREQFDWTA